MAIRGFGRLLPVYGDFQPFFDGRRLNIWHGYNLPYGHLHTHLVCGSQPKIKRARSTFWATDQTTWNAWRVRTGLGKASAKLKSGNSVDTVILAILDAVGQPVKLTKFLNPISPQPKPLSASFASVWLSLPSPVVWNRGTELAINTFQVDNFAILLISRYRPCFSNICVSWQ